MSTHNTIIRLIIKNLESKKCMCSEITWEPCYRCVKLVELRKKIGEYPYKDKVELVNPVKNTRHDNVYIDGIKWLDKL